MQLNFLQEIHFSVNLNRSSQKVRKRIHCGYKAQTMGKYSFSCEKRKQILSMFLYSDLYSQDIKRRTKFQNIQWVGVLANSHFWTFPILVVFKYRRKNQQNKLVWTIDIFFCYFMLLYYNQNEWMSCLALNNKPQMWYTLLHSF